MDKRNVGKSGLDWMMKVLMIRLVNEIEVGI